MVQTYRETLEQRVVKASKDELALNRLIKDFKPFIASVAQKKVGRYLQYGTDDELSISLIAFKEAVDSYNSKKGRFLSFARMVISLRLIDYYRKTNQSGKDEVGNEIPEKAIEKESLDSYRYDTEAEDMKEEIIRYSSELSRWGIDISSLADISPKQEKLKKTYQKVAKIIADDVILLGQLQATKRLPVKDIQKKVQIHRNKLERGRIYIIAMVIAIISGLSYMRMVDI